MSTLIISVAIVHLLAVMSPGPDFVVCLKNTLKYDRAAGIWTAFGFSIGVLIHVSYCLFGIAVLISKSIFWFSIIKFIGAAYLIYLGIQLLRSPSTSNIDVDTEKSILKLSPLAATWSGFLTNLLNPKATMYFLGLFSVMIPPDTSTDAMIVIVFILFAFTFLWFSFVASVMTTTYVRTRFLKFESFLNKGLGIALILLGVKVGLSKM